MEDFCLVVAKCPGNDYACSNAVYYKNLRAINSDECYLLFKKTGIIKLAKKLSVPGMLDKHIYLTQQERLNLKVMLGDVIETIPTDKPPISSKILISITDKTKLNEINTPPDIAISVLRGNIIGTVLTANTFYTFLAKGLYNAFIVSIEDMEKHEIQNGFIDDKTEIVISARNIDNNQLDNKKNCSNHNIATSIIILITDKKNKEIDIVSDEIKSCVKKNIINQQIKANTSMVVSDAPSYCNVHFISILNDRALEISTGFINCTTEIIFANNNNENLNNLQINLSSIDFETIGVGGLEKEFTELVKKLFITRLIPNSIYKKLGIKHTKGAILYGPPGCGKTRIARTLGEIMNCKNIQIINGPELKDKYVGESERKIRQCFDAAKNNPRELHLLIFDEFDSIAGTRSGGDSSKHSNSMVGQLLTMLDGFDEINNLIVFALTNRLDMIDPAILRPGRFGVHIKIDLPNTKGRHEILLIHSKKLIDNNLLDSTVDLAEIAKETENFTGAELELLVQNTIQHTIGCQIDFNDIIETSRKIENVTIAQEDFLYCLSQITPMFKNTKQINTILENKIKKHLSEKDDELILSVITTIKNSPHPIVYCLKGAQKSGKTSIVCQIAKQIDVDKIEYISASTLSNLSEKSKIDLLTKIFRDKISTLIILDNIEMIIEFISENIFNTTIFHCLKILLAETTHNVIITTSYYEKLSCMTFMDSVDFVETIA